MRFVLNGNYIGCETSVTDNQTRFYVGVQQGLEICRMSCPREVYDMATNITPYSPVSAEVSVSTYNGRMFARAHSLIGQDRRKGQ